MLAMVDTLARGRALLDPPSDCADPFAEAPWFSDRGWATLGAIVANKCEVLIWRHWLLQACLAVLGPVVLVGGGACGNLPCPWPWLLARGAPWIATAFLGNTMHSQGQCQLAFKHRSSAHCPTPLAQLTTLALLALLVDGTHNAAATWPKQCVSI